MSHITPSHMHYIITKHRIEKVKIVMLGHLYSGKSVLVTRFVKDEFFEEYDPTIEQVYEKQMQLNSQQSCLIHILDVSGDELFSSLQERWFCESHCVIISYYINELLCMESVIKPFLSLIHRIDENILIIVAGTKTNLRHDFPNYKHNLDFSVKFCQQNNICYIETSAKDKLM
ncbi:ras family small GTPase [Reticulomyxa filosa]|uniref:Ras family small GTPase n=1 Tax=Reticulomyxa filosa TaxID=46433 RepID=X6LZU0_RETFI|nr:ras family small GTPase [Reticulomyxa filosa]|eukprot:ETO07413.1 ras family small GTPase [Reticulomyxa filosa]